MPINFSTGGSTYLNKHPRVIYTTDTRSGCPPAGASGQILYTTTVVTTQPAIFYISSSIIKRWAVASERCDLGISVVGPSGSGFNGEVGRSLDYADHAVEWHTTAMYHAFASSVTGTWTISSVSVTAGTTCGSRFGCGSTWGGQTIMVFE
jgi:hypothetical protein